MNAVLAPPVPAAQEACARALAALLDGPRAALRAEVRGVLSEPRFAHLYDLERTRHREIVFERCLALAAHGWTAHDGSLGERERLLRLFAVFETLGISDPNLLIKFGLQFVLFDAAIRNLGTAAHHARYLPAVAGMALVGCFAMTEIGHGSNTRQLETVAEYDRAAGAFVVHTPSASACKQFIGNAAMHARMAIVFAQLLVDGERQGVHGLLVPLRREDGSLCAGVRIGDTGPKIGLAGIDNGWLAFEGVRVPRANLLDRFGGFAPDGSFRKRVDDPTGALLRTMSAGRVAVGLAALGMAKTGLAIAVRYGLRRRQFGPGPQRLLLDYPLHQRRLLPKLAEAYALHAALRWALEDPASRLEAPGEAFEGLAAALKAQATWAAVRTLQECREACGGQGYLAVNRVGALRADADALTTLEGDNTLLCLLAGKALVNALKKGQSAGAAAAFWRLESMDGLRASLGWRLRSGKLQRTDAPAAFAGLLALREQALLTAAAAPCPPDGGRDQQAPLLELAQAHVERLAFERFGDLVGAAAGEVKAALEELRELYALGVVARHEAWFLREGVLGARAAKALQDRFAAQCARVRPHAALLVDGFAIPDACLGAPIALSDPATHPEVPTCQASTSDAC